MNKLGGLERELKIFSEKLDEFRPEQESLSDLTHLIESEMINLKFDEVKTDEVGNVIGVIKAYGNKSDMVLLSNIDLAVGTHEFDPEQRHLDAKMFEKDKAGLITSIYTGALLKRSMTVLTGDVIVACIARRETCGFGVKQFFREQLKERNINSIILSEPTNFNVYLGNKGRLEYEIVVNDLDKKKAGAGFDETIRHDEGLLVDNLNNLSDRFPTDIELGKPTLMVKNVQYKNHLSSNDDYEIQVDVERTFTPGENEQVILQDAKQLADKVYHKYNANVNTRISEDLITTFSGKLLKEVKEYKPWKMEGYHPFVVDSLNALNENDFQSKGGYWKNRITEGSYTNGVLKIPTIGFGAGKYESTEGVSIEDLERSVYGKALIINRQIGVPTFGWTDDEI